MFVYCSVWWDMSIYLFELFFVLHLWIKVKVFLSAFFFPQSKRKSELKKKKKKVLVLVISFDNWAFDVEDTCMKKSSMFLQKSSFRSNRHFAEKTFYVTWREDLTRVVPY